MVKSLKRLAVLGSTGSIGRQTLEVVRALPDMFQVVALAAGQNVDLLAEQVREFKPAFVCYGDRDERPLPDLADTEYELLSMESIAGHPAVDVVVIAASGKAGLAPALAAAKAGKNIALANKESLVTAGEIIIREAENSGARLLPVDSEHSAIWQCLTGETQKPEKIILTASGGPFRRYTHAQLKEVTVGQALDHPSWQMGRKVTVDSATLMNKGLEIIEARWLFDMSFDNIKVLIHPQSIIHSMVEFADGSVKAQLGYPDMRLPIQYALTYPDRVPNFRLPRLDWGNLSNLDFEQPDFGAFPCLSLAVVAGKRGGTCPAVLCAADEEAVELFLTGRIGFTDIADYVERILDRHQVINNPSIEQIEAADGWAREEIVKIAGGDRKCC